MFNSPRIIRLLIRNKCSESSFIKLVFSVPIHALSVHFSSYCFLFTIMKLDFLCPLDQVKREVLQYWCLARLSGVSCLVTLLHQEKFLSPFISSSKKLAYNRQLIVYFQMELSHIVSKYDFHGETTCNYTRIFRIFH